MFRFLKVLVLYKTHVDLGTYSSFVICTHKTIEYIKKVHCDLKKKNMKKKDIV